ncbi:hypothetical protein R6Q59_024039 [Mikania micrantha]
MGWELLIRPVLGKVAALSSAKRWIWWAISCTFVSLMVYQIRCIRWYGGCQGIDFIVGSNMSFCWGKAGCYLSFYVAQLWVFCWVNFDWSVDFITGQSLVTIPYAKILFGILDCTIGGCRINSGWQVNPGTLLGGGAVRIWVMLPWDMKAHANWCKWQCDWDKQSLNGAVDMYGQPDTWPERLDAWVVWPIKWPVFCTWWGLICAGSPCVLSKLGLIWYGRPVVYLEWLEFGLGGASHMSTTDVVRHEGCIRVLTWLLLAQGRGRAGGLGGCSY